MAQTLDQIIKELDPGYSGSRKVINQQLTALPGQTQSQISGLQAQADQSHTDILDAARRRGLGFSGIPVGEQVKYDSTVFKPAVANLYSNENQQRLSLTDALNSLYRDQRNQATTLRDSQLSRDEQIRQFNANLAFQREQLAEQKRQADAANANIGGYFGGGNVSSGASNQTRAKVPTIQQRKGGGFNFTDASGRAISAAAYAKLSGTPFRTLLSEMAKKGDRGAAQALQYVGNDFGYNPNKVGANSGAVNLLNSLLWGVTNVKPYAQPARQSSYDKKLSAMSGGRGVGSQGFF